MLLPPTTLCIKAGSTFPVSTASTFLHHFQTSMTAAQLVNQSLKILLLLNASSLQWVFESNIFICGWAQSVTEDTVVTECFSSVWWVFESSPLKCGWPQPHFHQEPVTEDAVVTECFQSTVDICIALTVYSSLVSMAFAMLIRDALIQANKRVGVHFLTSVAPPSGQCWAYNSSPYLAVCEGISLRFVFSKLSPVMECFSLLL